MTKTRPSFEYSFPRILLSAIARSVSLPLLKILYENFIQYHLTLFNTPNRFSCATSLAFHCKEPVCFDQVGIRLSTFLTYDKFLGICIYLPVYKIHRKLSL